MRIEQSAEVEAVRSKKAELSLELTAVDNDRLRLARDNAPDDVSRDPLAARTAELLGEAPPKFPETKAEKLQRLAERARELRAAIDVLSSREAVALQRWETGIRVGVSEEHKRRLKALATALKSAHAASLSLEDLANEIENAGVSVSAMRADSPDFLGHPNNPTSPLAYWFRQVVETGAIPASGVPKELRYR